MLHPDLVLRKSPISGKGLLARRMIPKGTILWVPSHMRVYSTSQYDKFTGPYKALLRKYTYEDEKGNLIYCTDSSKYWNHSCNPNSAPSAPDEEMDMAVRDIKAGEEVTYDYVLLWTRGDKPFKCSCGGKGCRGTVRKEPSGSRTVRRIYAQSEKARRCMNKVRQPLLKG